MLTDSLTAPRRRLVRLLQRLNFGRVEGLLVRDGEPVWDSPPRVVREVKFGADNGPRPESKLRDFKTKSEVDELFRQLEAIGQGRIQVLEVKHGLPFRMIVEEEATALCAG
jgi:hypothetical protein